MSTGKRDRRIERNKAVEREFRIAITASEALAAALRNNPSLLKGESLGQADWRNLQTNLEATFLVRLFAEFETGLRDAWVTFFSPSPTTPVRDVISSIGVKRGVPETVQANVHAVRRYRNSLVHEEDSAMQPVGLDRARSYLCTFFSRLPPDW
jgi:hypothetical protein